MAFFIRNERRVWVGDLRWRSFERSPSLLTVHKVAAEFSSNYYVQSRTYPQHVGFLSAETVDTKEPFHSLALAISEKFGGDTTANTRSGLTSSGSLPPTKKGYLCRGQTASIVKRRSKLFARPSPAIRSTREIFSRPANLKRF